MIRAMIRVVMPAHLRTLAGVRGDVTVEVEGEVTRRSILDALETQYPMLRGTIREHVSESGVLRLLTEARRSRNAPDATLPCQTRRELKVYILAIAGG